MKKIVLSIITLLIGVSLIAQPPKGPANKGMTFGAKVTADGAVSANEVATVLGDKANVDLKVKGKVVEVCKAMGCWLRMETANGPLMIKMKGHSFFVPLAINGKTIVIDGTASMKEVSVEALKDQAEDAGKSKKEVAAITESKKEIILEAKGVLVL